MKKFVKNFAWWIQKNIQWYFNEFSIERQILSRTEIFSSIIKTISFVAKKHCQVEFNGNHYKTAHWLKLIGNGFENSYQFRI